MLTTTATEEEKMSNELCCFHCGRKTLNRKETGCWGYVGWSPHSGHSILDSREVWECWPCYKKAVYGPGHGYHHRGACPFSGPAETDHECQDLSRDGEYSAIHGFREPPL